MIPLLTTTTIIALMLYLAFKTRDNCPFCGFKLNFNWHGYDQKHAHCGHCGECTYHACKKLKE